MEASLRRTARAPLSAEATVTQFCAGAVLATIVLVSHRAERARAIVAVIAIALACDALVLSHSLIALAASAALATVFAFLGKRRLAIAIAIVSELLLFIACRAITDFIATLATLHLVAIAIVVGVDDTESSSDAIGTPSSRFDWVLFASATCVAACVSVFVLQRHIISGDEWADTFQADLFAHFKAYASPFPCSNAFRAWWVFDYRGRTFAQYTPGWPLIMAPFQRAGVAWLANPVIFGLGVAGVARLARRATSSELAGVVAGLALIASPAAVLNAASRYPHAAVCTTFAWLVEAAFVIRAKDTKMQWGLLLGAAAAMLLSIRPLDGVALGAPVAAFVAWNALTKQTHTRTLFAAAASFVAVGGLTLVILRLQLGAWLKTGYGIAGELRDLPPVSFSIPHASEIGPALAIDRGPSWWWPCNLALAALGLLLVRNRARSLAIVLGGAALVHALTYTMVNFARSGEDLGYGPRYQLPLLVPLAIGTSIAITTLIARIRSREVRGVFAIVPALAIVVALIVDARVYARFHAVLQEKRALFATIERANLHNAIVVVNLGELAVQPWDLTQNLSTVANADVYILTEWGAGEDLACARRTFADRTWYRAKGLSEVRLEPY